MSQEVYEPLLSGGEERREKPSIFVRYRKYFILSGIAVLAVTIVTLSTTLTATRYKTKSQDGVRFESRYGQFRFSAIADDSGLCGKIGMGILAVKGGSAVDAAIAGIMCTGVANIHSCGLGGSVIMTIYDTPRNGSEKEMITIIARDRAPMKATKHMFSNQTSLRGGLAVAVPGFIKGLHEAWLRFGRVSWAELIQPTIQLCTEGYAVNKPLAFAISFFEDLIRDDFYLRQQFIKPDGEKYIEGDIIKCTKLARTLHQIAQNPLSFYDPNSELAKDIVADLEEYGGIITTEDLENYKPHIEKPINITLQNGGYQVFSPRPPASGSVFSEILNILDGYNFSAADVKSMKNKIRTHHRIIEAYKFAYAEGSGLGDEEFIEVDEIVNTMTSKTFGASRRLMISDKKTLPFDQYGAHFEVNKDGGTAHMSLLAPDGSAVAISATINLYFGAKVLGSRTGIIFNNNMDDFSKPRHSNHYGVKPSPANQIEPGKMPISSMSPHIFLDGNGTVRYVGGASGGTAIPSATAYVAMNTLWFGKRVDESTSLFRFHHQLMPNEVCMEEEYDSTFTENQRIMDGLRSKGHKMATCGFAVVQAIHNTCERDTPIGEHANPCIQASSDGRKVGVPVGL